MTSIEKYFKGGMRQVSEHEKKIYLFNKTLLEDFSGAASYVKSVLKNFTEQYIIPELRPHVIIAGGSISTIISDYIEKNTNSFSIGRQGDIDIWVTKRPPRDIVRKQYDFFNKKNMETYSETGYADITKKKAFTYKFDEGSDSMFQRLFEGFQVIPTFIGSPSEIVNSFDYKHLMSIYDPATNSLKITQSQIHQILFKNLVPTEAQKILIDKYVEFDTMFRPKLKEILCENEKLIACKVLHRLEKYHTRGYKIKCH